MKKVESWKEFLTKKQANAKKTMALIELEVVVVVERKSSVPRFRCRGRGCLFIALMRVFDQPKVEL